MTWQAAAYLADLTLLLLITAALCAGIDLQQDCDDTDHDVSRRQ